MTLSKKRIWFTVTVSLALIILFSLATAGSFKYFIQGAVREQGHMAAEMLRVSLTEQMRAGVIKDRELLFQRMRTIPGLVDVRVIRGEPVIHQFGPGLNGELPKLEMEKRVLATGKWEEAFIELDGQEIYRVTIPYIAKSTPGMNCLQCHNVPENSINGAVTLGFSLESMQRSELVAFTPNILLQILFGLCLAYFLKRLFRPIVATAEGLKRVVSRAERGDFSGRITTSSTDEIGEIAVQTNNLMGTLEQSFGAISTHIQSLGVHRRRSNDSQNILLHTVHVVEEMVGATRFKQAVENDLDLAEIYERIRRVLKDHFGLQYFSFYEVDSTGQRLEPIFVEGLDQDNELWCSPEILANSNNCRAMRTAACVSNIDDPFVCSHFCGDAKAKGEFIYVCIPMMLSGHVGGVLQLLLSEQEMERHSDIDQTVQIYLHEAAPVVEARKLTQSLKDTAMRDPMTGLYNRRFLEDYVDVLTANTIRQKTSLGILMCDVDFFKLVNDDYGHDIGDQVLKGMAKMLEDTARASDMIIRFGGEEFMVLLPDTDASGCMELAERIRKVMEDMTFQTPQGPLKKTLSIGLSIFSKESEGFWAVVKFADIALYQAKEGGRNQCLIFSHDMGDSHG